MGETHGASIDLETGVFSWAPSAPGEYTFTARADDGRGGEDLQTWTVSVVEPSDLNQSPVIDPIDPIVLEADREQTFGVSVNDPDGDPVRYQLIDDPTGGSPLPDGVSIDPFTGQIDWTPTPEQEGPHQINVTATDGRGGSTTQTTSQSNFRKGLLTIAP